jgi:hypothetical protein
LPTAWAVDDKRHPIRGALSAKPHANEIGRKDRRVGTRLEDRRLSDKFRTVGAVEEEIAGQQPTLLDIGMSAWEVLQGGEVESSVADVAHPQDRHTARIFGRLRT